jgi:transcriptional accessory protein Tex/SPT6
MDPKAIGVGQYQHQTRWKSPRCGQ